MIAIGIDIGGSSVKAALLDGERLVARGRSDVYARPDAAAIRTAVRQAMSAEIAEALAAAGGAGGIGATGVCAPGVFDSASRTITLAVNMPGLVGVNLDELIIAASPPGVAAAVAPVTVVTDAHAAAFDYWSENRLSGRLVAISLGTGVGACVLDDGVPLNVTGQSCGHIGQVDVSLEDAAPVGPDGGRGSLEAYIGLAALRARYEGRFGTVEEMLAALTVEEPPVQALVRAIRIAHAIYRPDWIVLLGGVGVRLAHLAGGMRGSVSRDLTALARADWKLETGRHDWHAAAGAARLALAEAAESGTED